MSAALIDMIKRTSKIHGLLIFISAVTLTICLESYFDSELGKELRYLQSVLRNRDFETAILLNNAEFIHNKTEPLFELLKSQAGTDWFDWTDKNRFDSEFLISANSFDSSVNENWSLNDLLNWMTSPKILIEYPMNFKNCDFQEFYDSLINDEGYSQTDPRRIRSIEYAEGLSKKIATIKTFEKYIDFDQGGGSDFKGRKIIKREVKCEYELSQDTIAMLSKGGLNKYFPYTQKDINELGAMSLTESIDHSDFLSRQDTIENKTSLFGIPIKTSMLGLGSFIIIIGLQLYFLEYMKQVGRMISIKDDNSNKSVNSYWIGFFDYGISHWFSIFSIFLLPVFSMAYLFHSFTFDFTYILTGLSLLVVISTANATLYLKVKKTLLNL